MFLIVCSCDFVKCYSSLLLTLSFHGSFRYAIRELALSKSLALLPAFEGHLKEIARSLPFFSNAMIKSVLALGARKKEIEAAEGGARDALINKELETERRSTKGIVSH